MRHLQLLLAVLFFVSCQQKSSETNDLVIDSAKENPCIECTKKVRNECLACLAKAGSDQAKIDACNAKASKDWTEKCSLICKPMDNATILDSLTIEIGEAREAEKTKNAVDPTIRMTDRINGLPRVVESCSSAGFLRTITINNVCYSQMCCGGKWMFFYKEKDGRKIYCTCELGESWTVNCDGNAFIINCNNK
jgi:hypothetical protein